MQVAQGGTWCCRRGSHAALGCWCAGAHRLGCSCPRGDLRGEEKWSREKVAPLDGIESAGSSAVALTEL